MASRCVSGASLKARRISVRFVPASVEMRSTDETAAGWAEDWENEPSANRTKTSGARCNLTWASFYPTFAHVSKSTWNRDATAGGHRYTSIELRKSASETEAVFSLSPDEGGGEGRGQ